MTNPTQHGQVPEALIDLIDAYAETRHRCGGIYNAKTEAARKAVIKALSGVQALSAAPAVAAPAAPTPEHIAAMERAWLWMDNQADQQSKGGHATFDLMMLREERDALRAAIDAAPKAAPGEPDYSEKWDAELGRTAMRFVDRAGDVHPGIDDAETICAEFHQAMSEVIERMPHVQRMAASQQDAKEPYGYVFAEQYAPTVGSEIKTTREVFTRVKPDRQCLALYTAPAPLSDEVLKEVIQDSNRYRWLRRPLLHAGQGSIQVVMDDRLNGKIDRVIFLAELDKAIDAAIAAQGGKE